MEELLIEDLRWQLTFISEPEFDITYFKETLDELSKLRETQ